MLSEKPWKPEAVLRLFLTLFVCIFFGAALSNLMFHTHPGPEEHLISHLLIATFSLHGAALLLIYPFLRDHEMTWVSGFGFRHNPNRALGYGVVLALFCPPMAWVLQAAVMAIMDHFGFHPEEQEAVQTLRSAGGWSGQLVLALITIVLAPLAEEMLFRGILYPLIKRLGFPRLALWGTSLLFALIHFHLPSFLALLILALALTWLYEKTDNLLAPIVAHSLFNAANFAMLQLADKSSLLPPAHS